MTNSLGRQLIHATLARFEAERQNALATMYLYLNASVGVGEHPNIVEELAIATKHLTDADEAIDTLNRYFSDKQPTAEADE
jgi:hypothetical protein